MAVIASRDANGSAAIVKRAFFALVLTMAATSLHLPVSYALVKWTCQAGHRGPLLLVALGAAFATLGSAWLTWSGRARLRKRASDEPAGPVDLARFVTNVALGVALVLLLFVGVSTFAILVLSPCE
jgi:hypothetical protein